MSAYLDGLRGSLRYSSGAARRQIETLIEAETSKLAATIEAEILPAPARAEPPIEYPEERSGTAREAPSTGMRDGTVPSAVQTSEPASVGAQPAAPFQQATRVRGASRPIEKICPTCQKPFTTPWPAKFYCTGYCQTTRPYSHVGADRLCACGAVFKPRGSNQRSPAPPPKAPPAPPRDTCGCPACRESAKPVRASEVTAPPEPATEPATEPKQTPRRPTWRLGWDPTIKIMPSRPAPVRLYSDGVPTPFQDDLAAITDCGSPWAMMRTPALGQARLSTLAGAI